MNAFVDEKHSSSLCLNQQPFPYCIFVKMPWKIACIVLKRRNSGPSDVCTALVSRMPHNLSIYHESRAKLLFYHRLTTRYASLARACVLAHLQPTRTRRRSAKTWASAARTLTAPTVLYALLPSSITRSTSLVRTHDHLTISLARSLLIIVLTQPSMNSII